ncbi:MAG: tryptophan 2,3-dioxygenase, partial [Bdellovibrionales bacterium]|nr:tryptophan 2,3-dioxygenase [Bdellovibrionales bacterium]
MVHDELLFIITHQAFELWFKQVIFELDDVITRLSTIPVSDQDLSLIEQRFERMIAIQELMLSQFSVLETMTALDFLDFRDYLIPASGFQSFQFRLLESKMGLALSKRSQSQEYILSAFSKKEQDSLLRADCSANLFSLLETWLERMPFLEDEEFSFLQHYEQVIEKMLENEEKRIEQAPRTQKVADLELKQLEQNRNNFRSLFEPHVYEALIKEGKRRLSRKAMFSAIFIHLYRDYAIFHLPFRILTQVVLIDENWERWRSRHFRMIRKMIGKKIGTGGSSGHDYLKSTVEKHRVFSDFDQIPTYLIQRKCIPSLPTSIEKKMGLSWG